MLGPGDRPLPSRTSRGVRTPGHLVDCSLAMDGGPRWSSAMSSPARAPWQPGRSPGPGRSRGRTVPADPLPPLCGTAVTATEAGVQAGAKVPGIGGSSALDARCPAETMRQADASRSPLSRPSIDLPPTDYNARVEHMCENRWCGVLRTRTETVPERGHRLGPHRVVVGWTPCTCATALRPSGATGHRTYLCIVCEAEILVPPHTGPPFSGVQWPPRQTQEPPRPDSGAR